MSSSRPYTFDRVVRIIITVACIAGAVWLINLLKHVLLPFCLACLIAYILEPMLEMNMRILRLKKRGIPTFVTLFEVTLILGILTYLFIPSLIKELSQMSSMISDYYNRNLSIPLIPESVHDFIRSHFNLSDLSKLLSEQNIEKILDSGTSFVTGSLEFVMHTIEWFLTFIYVIFIMIDYVQLMRGFRMLVPPKYRGIVYRVGNDIKESMDRYFRGQALIALCAAVFYCIGFSIVGLPLAIVMGILVGVLYLIPYFQYITLIPVIILCLISSTAAGVEFWPMLGQCILVYVVSQCICDYVLTPKIMGKAMGLNPAIILLSLSVWGTLLGLIGMIIALPLTTLLLAYYSEYVINQGEKKETLQQKTD